MSLEDRVKGVFQKVLDVKPDEIEPAQSLAQSLGVDSTEMVEISVALKKELGVAIGDNEIKKTQTFEEIIRLLESKGAAVS